MQRSTKIRTIPFKTLQRVSSILLRDESKRLDKNPMIEALHYSRVDVFTAHEIASSIIRRVIGDFCGVYRSLRND